MISDANKSVFRLLKEQMAKKTKTKHIKIKIQQNPVENKHLNSLHSKHITFMNSDDFNVKNMHQYQNC